MASVCHPNSSITRVELRQVTEKALQQHLVQQLLIKCHQFIKAVFLYSAHTSHEPSWYEPLVYRVSPPSPDRSLERASHINLSDYRHCRQDKWLYLHHWPWVFMWKRTWELCNNFFWHHAETRCRTVLTRLDSSQEGGGGLHYTCTLISLCSYFETTEQARINLFKMLSNTAQCVGSRQSLLMCWLRK